MQNTGPKPFAVVKSDPQLRQVLDVRLTNLAPSDMAFLKGVIALFADPQSADGLAELRAGRAVIEYETYSGQMCLSRPAQPFGPN